MVHRGIASLAVALMLCFLLLSHFDGEFFMVHFYESLIYLAIVLMLFYFEDRWAYMIGMLAPAAWLLLIGAIGGFPGFVHQAMLALTLQRPDFAANLIGAVTLVLSVLMIPFCAYRWKREFAGLHVGWRTFLVSFAVVVLYYGAIVVWLLNWPAGA
jgi:hypothetical protein